MEFVMLFVKQDMLYRITTHSVYPVRSVHILHLRLPKQLQVEYVLHVRSEIIAQLDQRPKHHARLVPIVLLRHQSSHVRLVNIVRLVQRPKHHARLDIFALTRRQRLYVQVGIIVQPAQLPPPHVRVDIIERRRVVKL